MRRLKQSQPEPTVGHEMDLVSFSDSAPPERPKSKPRRMSEADFKDLLVKTEALKDAQQWSEFTPKYFVGLYCLLHHRVYSVFPHEVRDSYRQSVGAAHRMLQHEFNGDQSAMIEFMRWVWKRERDRERKRDPDNQFRIGWRLQFGSPLLSDYRVSKVRRKRR